MPTKIEKWYPLFVFVVGLFLYMNTLNHEFTQDDAIVITQNQFTKKGFEGIGPILGNDTFLGYFGDSDKLNLVAGGRYRPLSLVIFASVYEFVGENPFFFHLLNVLLYCLLGSVIYILAKKMFTNLFPDPSICALLTALIFVMHPVHTEVVANVKGLDEILALLFSSASFLVLFKQNIGVKSLIASALLFFLALMSKESAITMFGVLCLCLWILPIFSGMKNKFVLIAPILGSIIAFLILRASVLNNSDAQPVMELMNNPFLVKAGSGYIEMPLYEKLGTISVVMLRYLSLLVFPHPLTNDYYPHFFRPVGLASFYSILSIIIYAGLILFAVFKRKKFPIISLGILIVVTTLTIYSNIFFPIGTFMSERFLFAPSLGYCLALTSILMWVKNYKEPLLKLSFAIICLLFSFKTYTRNEVWKNNYTLFTTDVKVSKNSAKAQLAAGGVLMDAGKENTNKIEGTNQLNKAIKHFDAATVLHPDYTLAYELNGLTLIYQENYEEAIQYFEAKLKEIPGNIKMKEYLGISYREQGKYYGEKIGDLNKSFEYLKKANEIKPDDSETLRLLAVCSGIQGNHPMAIEYFKRSLSVDDKNASTWFNLSKAYEYAGDVDSAKQALQKAQSLDPMIGK